MQIFAGVLNSIVKYSKVRIQWVFFWGAALLICCCMCVAVSTWYGFFADRLPRPDADSIRWLTQSRAIKRDTSVVRYYTFQDQSPERGVFRNASGWFGHLKAASDSYDPLRQPYRTGPGRWPWKTAVGLEHVPLEAKPIPVQNRQFSVSAWIKHHGLGTIPGGNHPTSATILAMGDGVYSGWKLAVLYPSNGFVFELGQPKPEPTIGVASVSRVAPNVWTHVAATWDGNDVRLYINGLLSGRVAYQGPYAQVARSTKLRVGYVGNGLGSARFEIDEFLIHARCISAAEVLQFATLQHSIDQKISDQFASAGEALVGQQFSTALNTYSQLTRVRALAPELRALAALRVAECLREQEEFEAARKAFEQLAADDSAPEPLRHTALLEALALREGVPKDDYRPLASEPGQRSVNYWRLAGSASEYDRALLEYSLARSQQHIQKWKTEYESVMLPLLKQYCHACHNGQQSQGALDLAAIDHGEIAADASVLWDHVFQRVRDGQMPPDNSPPLSPHDRARLLRWIEFRPTYALCEELATDENARSYHGFAATRRFTRAEFKNAIRDLLGIQLTADEEPPLDGFGGEGFDNVGDVLFTSSIHIDVYLQASKSATSRAVAAELDRFRAGAPLAFLAPLPQSLDPTSTLSDHEAAQQVLLRFARRAWRRPLEGEETQRILTLFDQSAKLHDDYQSAITDCLTAILVSPHFLFAVELDHGTPGVHRLTPHQLATRLALFLWSSIPDEQLLERADSKAILQPHILRAEVQRMLHDQRARALGETFGAQWLGLQRLSEREPDAKLYPEYNSQLAEDMRQEVVAWVEQVFRQNRPLLDLISSDQLYINGLLEKIYDIYLPADSPWQTVRDPEGRRGGVLTMAAPLVITSYSYRTSPVLRGKWILEQILGQSVAQPPDNVPSLADVETDGKNLTTRELLTRHGTEAACAQCHRLMDPLGICLENYDVLGRWRDSDQNGPIDPSGSLPDGQLVSGAQGLKNALLARRDQYHRHIVRKLLGFALGRGLNRFDECVVERCLRRLADQEFRAGTLCEEIALSYPFQHRFFKD